MDRDGTVLTSAHVADGRGSTTATLFNGQRVMPVSIARDLHADIAVFRLRTAWRPYRLVELKDSDRLRVGTRTLIVGGVIDLGFTVTCGSSSDLAESPAIIPA